MEGDFGIARLTCSGTYEGGFPEEFGVPDSAIGSQVTVTNADYFRFENGMIAEGWGVSSGWTVVAE